LDRPCKPPNYEYASKRGRLTCIGFARCKLAAKAGIGDSCRLG
jgi:hypothetical protein